MRTVTRRFALQRVDLEGAVCPVPEEIAEALRGRESVSIVLQHRYHGVTPVEGTVELPPGPEIAVSWPDDMRPGVLVTLSWRPAKDDLLIKTVPLDDALAIDGVEYFHEYDAAAVTRDFDPGRSNHGQVLGVVRRLGRVFEDGSAVFAEDGLVAKSGLGRGTKGRFLLANAVEQLIREGFVTRVTGSLDADGEPSYPPVDGEETADMLFYAPLVEPLPHASDRGEHWVNGFVRKLPRGAQPSEKQLAMYEQLSEETLAPGYTFVKKHHRTG
ncbi:hypothetical protein AB0M02_41790 [Actinoplanes sp. NPDC051861]|uniref:hypothetical protein n=1 Tax=Actinoplanes sp. NPDC051861 TaxID=3155170 RepID=UPI0034152228